MQAIQEAKNIDAGVDTRTKKEEDEFNLKDVATFVAEMLPGVGEAIALKRTSDALDEKDYVGAGIEATAGLLGLIPGVGDAAGKVFRSLKPKKTVKAYKLFTKGEDGNLYPLFVDADTKIPEGEFISAVIPESVFTAPNGKKYVPSKGTGDKKGTGDNIKIPDQATRDILIEKGFLPAGSKAKTVKAVALRPGFHAGDSPAAPHIGLEYKGQKYRSDDQVWAEVEMPADNDWQSVADANASVVKSGPRKGLLNVGEAQITDQLPSGGYYRYKTNPNMQGNWLISGEMKVNRVLDADEVKRLNDEAGTPDLPTLAELKAKEVGYDKDNPIFHATKKDFSQIDLVPVKGDIGFHVGTSKQADFRLPYLPKGATALQRKGYLEDAEGARFLKLALREDLKPLRVPDIGQFKQPDNWLGQIAVDTDDVHIIRYLNQEPEDAALLASAPKVEIDGKTFRMQPDVRRTKMPPEVWTDLVKAAYRNKVLTQGSSTSPTSIARKADKQISKMRWFTDLKDVLNKHGYDSLVYRNEYEGAFDMADSYMLTEPDQVKNVFGGMTPGDPDLNKNRGGLMMQEGGAVPMRKQMELFMDDYQVAEVGMDQPKKMAEGGMMKDGGLEQDGGTIDPVSGNKVPPGSAQEEVRDDIPAQLSEGEFVFPADVVRYIGLEKLMRMRQEAKMGLKLMDEMGQMGNADEATIPDDLPFTVTDLIIVDDGEDVDKEDKKEYNIGGMVPQIPPGIPTPREQVYGVTYQAPQFQAGQTQVGMAASPIEMAPIARREQQATPVYQAPQTLPTASEFIAPPEGTAPTTITIVNEETGEERVITFIPGATEIPEGFVRKEDYVPKEVVPETPTTTVETATVREESDADEERRRQEEAMYGPGGGRLGFKDAGKDGKDLIFGVSFDMPEGFMPGAMGALGTGFGLLSGKPLPADVTVNFKRGEIEFSMSGTEYNDLKSAIKEFGSGSDEAKAKLNKYGLEQAVLEKRQRDFMEAQAEKMAKEARGSELAKAREIADERRRKAAIEAALEKQKQEAIAAAETERQYVESQGYQQDDDDDPGGFTVTDASGQEYTTDSSGTAGAFTGGEVGMEDEYDFNTGGLAGKKKPKAKKKMKRGGLASKK